MTATRATLIVPGDASGPVVYCAEGLSFWGGVDPHTGTVIDAQHSMHGAQLTGRIVLMPTSRGSCSGSGVLLELARESKAPAGLVFRDSEEVLTLGAIIAARLFDAPVVVLRLSSALFDALSRVEHAAIQMIGSEGVLRFGNETIALSPVQSNALTLSSKDRAMLQGEHGAAAQLAMEVTCTMGAVQGVKRLVDVSRAHIDGCILAHNANLVFAEKMQRLGARTSIPTTINAISIDRENWQSQGVDPDFARRASRLADAYVAMGAIPTFTCAPYLLDDAPVADDMIGWSESNAVIYANSVLGARTEKHPDYLDLFIAVTGRAPEAGVYLASNRRPACVIEVHPPPRFDESIWPMIGWLAGMKSPAKIPILIGLEAMHPSEDDLKALCAAFGTTSAAPMLHVAGHSPEGNIEVHAGALTETITCADLRDVWQRFNQSSGVVAPIVIDLVAIGSPHASLAECRTLCERFEGQRCNAGTAVILTVGRGVFAAAMREGVVQALSAAGVQIIQDLCWCSITEPVFPKAAKALMTNSGKYAHYAQGLTGRDVRFGSLADCVRAAVTGRVAGDAPPWLRDSAVSQKAQIKTLARTPGQR